MSKIGKKEIILPAGVELKLIDNLVAVKGPKGSLDYQVLSGVTVVVEGNVIKTSIDNDENKKFWGLTRTLIANMIEGVTTGYTKKLMILGVGYGAKVQGQTIQLSLGFSHPVKFDLPKAVTVTAEKDPKGNDILTFTSIDKQLLGQMVAKIRDLKKPEPYKGKGIRYIDEVIKLKAGKTSKK